MFSHEKTDKNPQRKKTKLESIWDGTVLQRTQRWWAKKWNISSVNIDLSLIIPFVLTLFSSFFNKLSTSSFEFVDSDCKSLQIFDDYCICRLQRSAKLQVKIIRSNNTQVSRATKTLISSWQNVWSILYHITTENLKICLKITESASLAYVTVMYSVTMKNYVSFPYLTRLIEWKNWLDATK